MEFKMKRGVRYFSEKKSKATHLLNPYTQDRIKVDEMGTIMFNLMREKGTFDTALKTLCELYPETEEGVIREAFLAYVEGLKKHNIFEVIDDEGSPAPHEG